MMPVLSPGTSLSLLERLRAGDAEAWGRMVALYTPLLRVWLRPAGLQPADIQDVTQNALAVVVRRLPEYRHNGRVGAFRAWLRGIIRNVLRDFLRAAGRRPDREQLLADLEDEGSDLNRRWEAEHDRHVLRGLLDVVRDEFRGSTWRAFCRTALDGVRAPEVAAELGLSVNAVHVARSRVLARLRREARNFVDLP
jgi:RNA polymerase sigma-70 factor (ECF subfamily)